jgi:hypothetical protein
VDRISPDEFLPDYFKRIRGNAKNALDYVESGGSDAFYVSRLNKIVNICNEMLESIASAASA